MFMKQLIITVQKKDICLASKTLPISVIHEIFDVFIWEAAAQTHLMLLCLQEDISGGSSESWRGWASTPTVPGESPTSTATTGDAPETHQPLAQAATGASSSPDVCVCVCFWSLRVCTSYPEQIIVPAVVTDQELENVAAFRSWKRIPAVVYRWAYF